MVSTSPIRATHTSLVTRLELGLCADGHGKTLGGIFVAFPRDNDIVMRILVDANLQLHLTVISGHSTSTSIAIGRTPLLNRFFTHMYSGGTA